MEEKYEIESPETVKSETVPDTTTTDESSLADESADTIDTEQDMTSTRSTNAEASLELRPLSEKKFVAFFQKYYRGWLGLWYPFDARHPKVAKIIYLVGFYMLLSAGVFIVQYILISFLPYAFESLNDGEFGWAPFQIMGEPCTIVGSAKGLGYFIAYEIAVFVARCINFPLQRNITFRSHGNPWFQALWYLIAWLIISFICGALWGMLYCCIASWPALLLTLLQTIITALISSVVLFFIFLIIFPDVDKVEEAKRKRCKKKKSALDFAPSDARREKAYRKAEFAVVKAEETKKIFHAEAEIRIAKSLAEAKISTYLAMKKNREPNTSGQGTRKSQKKTFTEEDVEKAKNAAVEAVLAREETLPVQQAILDEVKSARAERAAATHKKS